MISINILFMSDVLRYMLLCLIQVLKSNLLVYKFKAMNITKDRRGLNNMIKHRSCDLYHSSLSIQIAWEDSKEVRDLNLE